MVTIDPEDLSPSQLVSFMGYMHEYSQVPKTYQLAFWQKMVDTGYAWQFEGWIGRQAMALIEDGLIDPL